MAENLETGKDKLKKICEILKNETIEPAKEEAQKVIEIAQQEALKIIKEAEEKAGALFVDTQKKLKQEKQLFSNAMQQACKQGIEALRQDIDNTLFNDAIDTWVQNQTKDPQTGARLITALVQAVEKEGTSADFSAAVASKIKPEEINVLLANEILSKLKEKSVVVGDFIGGVELTLHDKKLTLDLSNEALKELLGNYLRKDFRELLFKSSDQVEE